jgi:anion-transporting  ArsA/GET3 family ATPase
VSLPLLRRRLIFVTGKGGVGKTTVSLALGLAASRRGMRTIVADLEGEPRTRGSADEAEERQVADGLYRISIDPQSAMEEYLLLKLPPPANQMLRQSKLFGAFAMATPGMRELLCIGKLWELAQLERRTRDAAPYDLVIVDAPASGHGAAMLRTPRTFADIARVGPIASQAQAIAQTLADPAFTAVATVTTPEEMPVNETLLLRQTLLDGADPTEIQSVIVNGCHPDRFSPGDLKLLAQYAGSPAVELALAASRRAANEQAQQERLREVFGDRIQTLPYLFRPELELDDIELLAQELVR